MDFRAFPILWMGRPACEKKIYAHKSHAVLCVETRCEWRDAAIQRSKGASRWFTPSRLPRCRRVQSTMRAGDSRMTRQEHSRMAVGDMCFGSFSCETWQYEYVVF